MIARVRALSAPHRAAWVLGLGLTLSLAVAGPELGRRVGATFALPVVDPWLPPVLASPVLFALALAALALAGLAAALYPTPATLRAWAWTTLGAGGLGLVHQAMMGWAGSELLFWIGVWALWLTHARTGLERGPWFCLLLIGGLFAWPALGKLTPGYWTGELYWEQHWSAARGLHGWLSATLGPDRHRALVAWFGPLSIAMESLIALAWLLPGRLGFVATFTAAAGIVLLGGGQFLQAMGPLVALALSGWVLADGLERSPAPTAPR